MTRIQAVHPLDPAGGRLLEEWVAVHAAADDTIWNGHGITWSVDEVRELQRGTAGRRTALAAVDLGGGVLGAVQVLQPLRDNLDRAHVWLSVRPDRWRQGTGSTLLKAAEDVARAGGRTIISASSNSREESGGTAAAFAGRHGFALGQVELRQELSLSADLEPTDPEPTVSERTDPGRSKLADSQRSGSGLPAWAWAGTRHTGSRRSGKGFPRGGWRTGRCSLGGSAPTHPGRS